MELKVDIDNKSGFCGGVIRAIAGAERYLHKTEHNQLFSLGSIVHNEAELERLQSKGLDTLSLDNLDTVPSGSTVLIRAHGEPPSTYKKAKEAGLELIDYTCPVVLKLQQRIRDANERVIPKGGQILIFGKVGHAEVLGLVGQVANGEVLVIESPDKFEAYLCEGKLKLKGPIEIFSQTTKSPKDYLKICNRLREEMTAYNKLTDNEFADSSLLSVHSTICSQVSNRHEGLLNFSRNHSIIIFVSGKESSNGKVLCNLCRSINPRTYMVGSEKEVDATWFHDGDTVGVCGATSTPKWLLEAVANKILRIC